jgi:hypothetical protein
MNVNDDDWQVELRLSSRFKRSLRRDITSWWLSHIKDTCGGYNIAKFNSDKIADKAECMADKIEEYLEVKFKELAHELLEEPYPDAVVAWLNDTLDQELDFEKRSSRRTTILSEFFNDGHMRQAD